MRMDGIQNVEIIRCMNYLHYDRTTAAAIGIIEKMGLGKIKKIKHEKEGDIFIKNE